jgi:hypothetical protein
LVGEETPSRPGAWHSSTVESHFSEGTRVSEARHVFFDEMASRDQRDAAMNLTYTSGASMPINPSIR